MEILQIIYISRVSRRYQTNEVLDMLQAFKSNNLSRKITGILLYKNDHFMQMIEGAPEVVEALFERIKADSRHYNVAEIYRKTAKERLFPDWSMSFHHLNNGMNLNITGYNDYLDTELSDACFTNQPQVAFKFLRLFKLSSITY